MRTPLRSIRMLPGPALAAVALGLFVPLASAQTVHDVPASSETEPIASGADSLEDVALWTGGGPAVVLVTDSQSGVLVQGLDGTTRGLSPDGVVDGVDVLPGFPLGGGTVRLVLVANRTTSSVWAYALDPSTGALTELPGSRFGVGTQPRALAAYRAPGGEAFVFTADAQGTVRQYALGDALGTLSASLVRELDVGGEVGDLVVDSAQEQLYATSLQTQGLVRFSAKADAGVEGVPVAANLGPLFGVGLYALSGGQGYLVVSQPGSEVLTVLRRDGAVEGRFRVVANDAGVDGVEETRALALSAANLGGSLSGGLLAVMDRFGDTGQNVKLVRWEDVARAFDPPLRPYGTGGGGDAGTSGPRPGGKGSFGPGGGGSGLPVPEDDDGCASAGGAALGGPLAGVVLLLLGGAASLRRRPRSRRMPPPREPT